MKTDIIVVGGGHAGIEAANSAAKSGLSVMLITGNVDLIGQMSCNPAIGGIAKGNIVREVDALGGLMGRITDRAGIQFQDMVTGIMVKEGRVCGVRTESGQKIEAAAVVLAMGTFLNGLAHIGMESFPCGRLGESASL